MNENLLFKKADNLCVTTDEPDTECHGATALMLDYDWECTSGTDCVVLYALAKDSPYAEELDYTEVDDPIVTLKENFIDDFDFVAVNEKDVLWFIEQCKKHNLAAVCIQEARKVLMGATPEAAKELIEMESKINELNRTGNKEHPSACAKWLRDSLHGCIANYLYYINHQPTFKFNKDTAYKTAN